MTDGTDLEPTVVPRRADQLQIDAGPRDDPFEAVLILSAAGPDPTAVALMLTPALLGDLVAALHQVKAAQLEQLGIDPSAEKPSVTNDVDQDLNSEEQSSAGLQRLHRAADPLGLRHLRARKTRPVILVVVALTVVALTLILQVVQR